MKVLVLKKETIKSLISAKVLAAPYTENCGTTYCPTDTRSVGCATYDCPGGTWGNACRS